MQKREFLQLAKDFDLEKDDPSGMLMSEKMDGHRCYWDGGITRGLPVSQVPWANSDKLGRSFLATGLWTRSGHPYHAPDSFIDKLPVGQPLDGEFWMGHGGFQDLGFIKSHDKDSVKWEQVKYYVFGAPTYNEMFQEGRIKTTIWEKIIGPDCLEFVKSRGGVLTPYSKAFIDTLDKLHKLNLQPPVYLLSQIKLPDDPDRARDMLFDELDAVLIKNGEGLMLASPHAAWHPSRMHTLLKVKKYYDTEGTVVGYTTGKRTTKGSRLLGKMGAVIVKWKGKEFEIGSGFTDSERVLASTEAVLWATRNPGAGLPPPFFATAFPIGTTITFKYRELTRDGIPREATYHRKAQ